MQPNVRLGLVVLAVEDLRRSLAFYRQAFGWEQAVDAPSYAELKLPNAMRLGLYQRTGFGVNTGKVPLKADAGELLPSELYLYPDDLPAALQQVAKAGGRLLSPPAPRSWGDEAAYFADPDGHVVVLARPHARENP